MGGQPPTTPIQNPNQDYKPIALAAERPWEIPSSHPEYLSQGLASGLKSLGSGATQGFSAIYQANKEKAKEEREDQLLFEKYAHEARMAKNGQGGGMSFGIDMGYIPQAQGVNYQPDQFTQKYGYNIQGTEA